MQFLSNIRQTSLIGMLKRVKKETICCPVGVSGEFFPFFELKKGLKLAPKMTKNKKFSIFKVVQLLSTFWQTSWSFLKQGNIVNLFVKQGNKLFSSRLYPRIYCSFRSEKYPKPPPKMTKIQKFTILKDLFSFVKCLSFRELECWKRSSRSVYCPRSAVNTYIYEGMCGPSWMWGPRCGVRPFFDNKNTFTVMQTVSKCCSTE